MKAYKKHHYDKDDNARKWAQYHKKYRQPDQGKKEKVPETCTYSFFVEELQVESKANRKNNHQGEPDMRNKYWSIAIFTDLYRNNICKGKHHCKRCDDIPGNKWYEYIFYAFLGHIM